MGCSDQQAFLGTALKLLRSIRIDESVWGHSLVNVHVKSFDEITMVSDEVDACAHDVNGSASGGPQEIIVGINAEARRGMRVVLAMVSCLLLVVFLAFFLSKHIFCDESVNPPSL